MKNDNQTAWLTGKIIEAINAKINELRDNDVAKMIGLTGLPADVIAKSSAKMAEDFVKYKPEQPKPRK